MSATEWHPTTRVAERGAPPDQLAVRRLGERLGILAAPEILDEQAARAYARTALAVCDDGVRELVLDLTAVRRHVWPAVYALCELEARLTEACCDPMAAASQPLLVQDLRAVGLDRAWKLMPHPDAAVTELLSRPV